MFFAGKSKKFLLWLLNQTAIRDKRDVWEATKRCFFGSEKVLNFSEWKESNEILMKEFLVRLNDETFLFSLQSSHSLFRSYIDGYILCVPMALKASLKRSSPCDTWSFQSNSTFQWNWISRLLRKKCKKPAENLSPLLCLDFANSLNESQHLLTLSWRNRLYVNR